MIQVKEYNNHKKELIGFLEDLQDHVIGVDPLKRFVRLPEYGETYADELLESVRTQDGKIFFAEYENSLVGVIS